jgi:hypothetical protein
MTAPRVSVVDYSTHDLSPIVVRLKIGDSLQEVAAEGDLHEKMDMDKIEPKPGDQAVYSFLGNEHGMVIIVRQ